MTFKISVTDDLDRCLKLRFAVFVDEQGVPVDEERDALDDEAVHVIAEGSDTQAALPLATARVLCKGNVAKIGRVCVRQDQRGKGLGAEVIRSCLGLARERSGIRQVILGGQIHALGFYEALGFEAFGPIYLDAGIEHQDMRLNLID